MKICKDCKHFQPAIGGPHCALTVDPVTGGPKELCAIERKHGDCGHLARNFEARPERCRRWWQGWFS